GNLVYHNNVKKAFLWVHDVLPFNNQCHALLHIQYHTKKFMKILCLCDWHKEYIHKKTHADENKISVTRNAILTRRFARQPKKIPFRFIYASGASRGLEHLLNLMPRIYAEFPQSTLHVFTDLNSLNTKGNNEELKKMINDLPYVTLRGRVSQDVIAHEFLISDIWFYPTDFSETYCITALEAQAAGLLCACSGLSSLPEIVGDRGIVGGENIKDSVVATSLVDELLRVMKNPEEKKALTVKARKWAMKQNFENLAQEWAHTLFSL
ncbi:glycosyltransferase family 4 protein, partial [bacterium]|nr:glycosyltransferase family 4 protein [bacterium]